MPTRSVHPEIETRQRTNEGNARLQVVANVMVPVEDPDRAIAFYTEKLGLEVVADRPYGDGRRWIELAPHDGETTLALVPSHGDYRAGSHTGVVLATTDAVAVHDEMHDTGIDVDPEIMGGGDVPAFFWFRDSDDNTLMVVEGD
jgi:catechol 2,3-dioxygenase-like lactoylglutathione lyase family enzyme